MKALRTKWFLFGMFFVSLFAFLFPQKGLAQTQNFNGTFPPAGFSAPVGTGIADDGVVKWYRGDTLIVTDFGNAGLEPGRGGSGHCAVFNTYDIHPNGKADLIMEDVNLSGYVNAELRFYLKNVDGLDTIRVFARNGANAYVQYGASFYGVYSDWTVIVIDLTGLSGGSNTLVDIRFEGTSDYNFSNIGLDDISVAEPAPPPPAGSFDGTFPPAGFSAPVGTGTSFEGEVRWYRGDTLIVTDDGNSGLEPGSGGSGHCAVFNSYDIHSNGKADLIMENVDLSVYANAELSFYMRNTTGADVVRVYARNASDSYVQYGATSYGVYSDWTQILVDLTSLSGGGNTLVDIRFEGTSDFGFSNIGLDDVSIAEGTPPPPPLSGTFNIGPTGDYPSLTSAFTAITTSGLGGAVILELQSTYTSAGETFPIVASSNATVTNTITVRPATGATALVIGTSTFGEVAFKFNGSKYVTIDGRPGGVGTSNQLTIQSTGGFGVALQVTNDATNNVVKFCIVNAPSGFFAVSIDASVSTGNSSNLISDCVIGGDDGNPSFYGVSIGGTIVSNANNTVLRCNIANCFVGISLDTLVNTTLIDQCNFYTTSPFSGTGVVGMLVNQALNTTVQRCKFYDLSCNEYPVTITGILVGGGTGAGSSTLIKNNFFSLDGASTTDSADVTAILYASAGASDTCQVFFNTIYIGGSAITGGSSWGIHKTAAASVFTQQNNVVINARSNSSGSGTHYAVAIDNVTGVGTVDYNNYQSTGTGGILGSWNSVNKTTLTDWKTASGHDANSVSKGMTFVGVASNDLHLAGGSVGDVQLIGTPIGGITIDIDAETRHATVPYMGADENVGSPLPVEVSMFTAAAHHLDAQLRWTTATETNNYGFEVERRAVSNPPITINWGKIGFVAGAGTSSSPHEYSLVDKNVAPGRYAYRIKQIDNDGRFKYAGQVEVEVGFAPKEFVLGQNYPNPFNPSTTIEFTLSVNGLTTLKVFDMLGREVATLFHGETESGRYYQVTFSARGGSAFGGNGRELASGIYFSVLESGGKQLIKKMLLLK